MVTLPAGTFSVRWLPAESNVNVVVPVLSTYLESWLAASHVYVLRTPPSSFTLGR